MFVKMYWLQKVSWERGANHQVLCHKGAFFCTRFRHRLSQILSIFKDWLCHLEGLNLKCFCAFFFLTALPREGQSGVGGGGGGWGKRDISYQHSDLMYIMCSTIQEADTPPAGVCDSRGNSCLEIIGTKEVSGRKEATSVPSLSVCF